MRAAFKEWAVVVDALGRGEQIVILRKGGISEGREGFQLEQPEFLLFPTLYHQQGDSVIPTARARFPEIASKFPSPNQVRIDYLARVVAWERLESLADAERLRGQHIWRDEVISQRFEWGRQKNIFALAVRVFRLTEPAEIPLLAAYGGCKSWIELEKDVATLGAEPILSENAFNAKLDQFRLALRGEITVRL